MQLIDLHMHSTYSDGTDSPAELVELAIEKDLVAIRSKVWQKLRLRLKEDI